MRKNKLDIIEIIDLVLPMIKPHQRIRVPQFTRLDAWFDGVQKIAPRTLRQK